MKTISKVLVVSAVMFASANALAEPASSLKHAGYSTKMRQAVFGLLGSNMGPLGAMAKGKMPVDAEAVEKYALRINQLSFMIADYTRTDTSKFKVKTEALDKVWSQRDQFLENIDKLTLASANLQKAAETKDETKIKTAIKGVGKTCGGCHDDFKEE